MYLDTKGLVALWREALLAKAVLAGNTTGYTAHPQLLRFRNASKPLDAINYYLSFVWEEASKRNFNFDRKKYHSPSGIEQIDVTTGQLAFEGNHLLEKLMSRDIDKFATLKHLPVFIPHPLFKVIKGEIATWEKT